MAAVKQVKTHGRRTPVGAGNTSQRYRSPLDKAKGYEVIWQQVAPVFDAARIYAGACFVYIIGEPDEGPVKIGSSKDPIARLRQMQTGNPRRLRIEHILVGDVRAERLLHEMWERHAIKSARSIGKADTAPGTEWFEPQIRPVLAPIIATAAHAHAERLRSGSATLDDMELLLRQAHALHGYTPARRHETRTLSGNGSDYRVSRKSLI